MVLGVGLVYINIVFVETLGSFDTGPSLPSSARALVSGASIGGVVGRSR